MSFFLDLFLMIEMKNSFDWPWLLNIQIIIWIYSVEVKNHQHTIDTSCSIYNKFGITHIILLIAFDNINFINIDINFKYWKSSQKIIFKSFYFNQFQLVFSIKNLLLKTKFETNMAEMEPWTRHRYLNEGKL